MPVFWPAAMADDDSPRIRPIVAANLPQDLSRLDEDASPADDDGDMLLCGLCESDALLTEPIVGYHPSDSSPKGLPSPKEMSFSE